MGENHESKILIQLFQDFLCDPLCPSCSLCFKVLIYPKHGQAKLTASTVAYIIICPDAAKPYSLPKGLRRSAEQDQVRISFVTDSGCPKTFT